MITDKERVRRQKISKAMKDRQMSNFAAYQKEIAQLRPSQYKKLETGPDLAELIGAVLGDGYIGQHERTQVLRIVSNSNNPGFIDRYTKLVASIFAKAPTVRKRTDSNCIDIVIYQNAIAERLGLQTGAKTRRLYVLPAWITSDVECKRRFLRGLYETDGCLASHARTYTHKFIFSNVNESLLNIVFMLLCEFGFHPTKTKRAVQLSRKKEVEAAAALLQFRQY